MLIRFVIIIPLLAGFCYGGEASRPLPEVVDFNRDIRPIFSDNCYACHGPDKNKRKGEPPLRLDTHDGIFSKRDDTCPVVPGKIDDSTLYTRITSDDPDTRMPDPKSNKRLTDRQIAMIKKWIEQGAPWKDHWAYLPPARPAVPDIRIPPAPILNPIDAFILAKLDEQNLHPSPEADQITLVRRLYLDLTGLPPTPQEVDAFVHDPSPYVYDVLVDQLLASPHFGERMAVYWLDLVRYADTIGYHSDNNREIAAYRDYVINAFNNNLPFDLFTTEQLAGDLLPNPTIDQKVASGYNRLIETTEEGGAQPKEYAAKSAADRVRNVSSVWLGSTMACCQCHDHKFDPFKQRDFYSMAAFFDDIKEPAIGKLAPELMLPTPEQAGKLKELDEAVASIKQKLEAPSPELTAAQQEWEQSNQIQKAVDWKTLVPAQANSKNGATLKVLKDNSILATGSNPDNDVYTIQVKTKLKGITAIRLEALPDKSLPASGPGRAPNGNFVLTEFMVEKIAEKHPTTLPVANASSTHDQTDFPVALTIGTAKKDPMRGWAILPQLGVANNAVFELASDIGTGEEITLAVTLRFEYPSQHTIGHLRLAVTDAPRPVRASSVPKEIQAIIAIAADKRTEAQNKAISEYFRSISPLMVPIRAQLAATEKQKQDLVGQVRKTLISISDKPRITRILPRGDWLNETGDVVSPAVPGFLVGATLVSPSTNRATQVSPLQSTTQPRLTRLDLARWLASPANPLTARVMVNRLWKLLYGQGIASSLDDLGSQGSSPTHPELLDYLACEFTDSGWDIKHMMRLMVTSSTYRQTSTPSKELVEADPYNKWLARQGRFRLDAEFVRDDALAVSGLLAPTIGGDSVKPYQPASYWEFLNFPKRTYEPSPGENQYRRGLYTHWQRTFLQPSLANFDAPSREECTAQRPISNTPQQALTLLNDPTYVEAARVFAQHILAQPLATPADRLSWAYRQALSRKPHPQELSTLTDLLEKHRQEYAGDKTAAKTLLSTGQSPLPAEADLTELAAWTSVSRTILNLHETITRY